MSRLRRSADDYLRLRRGVGYKLDTVEPLLRSFVTFAEAADAVTITTELAIRWASQPTEVSPIWLAHRLSVVRGFARWLQTVDPATEIPPAGLLPAPGYQPAPAYLYSQTDIAALMAAARRLNPPLRAATFEALIGLLAVTGMRIGEAMRLDRDDIDWEQGVVTVHSSKFGRSRELVCHPSTIEALRAYAARRDELCPHPATASFFVSTQGRRLTHHSVYASFRPLLIDAGLGHASQGRPPRVHDLRHAFALRTLIGWYHDGADVQALLPLLSTYMGHIQPSSTMWYLSASPELLALAAQRRDRISGASP
jgi:integrase